MDRSIMTRKCKLQKWKAPIRNLKIKEFRIGLPCDHLKLLLQKCISERNKKIKGYKRMNDP